MDGTDEEDFYATVVKNSKVVLMESKQLIDLVSQQNPEDDILEAARRTAKCTFELLDYVNNRISVVGEENITITMQYLLDSTREVRNAVLELIKAARSLYSNPLDFLSKQTMDNCLGEVVRTIKNVKQASERLQEEDQGGEDEDDLEFDVVHDTRVANKALQNLFQITKQQTSTEVFVQTAKDFLDAMNQLMVISKSLALGLDDRLKGDSLVVINSAKVLTKDRTNQSHSKKFQDSLRQCQATMKAFLFECSKSRDDNVRSALSPAPQTETQETEPVHVPPVPAGESNGHRVVPPISVPGAFKLSPQPPRVSPPPEPKRSTPPPPATVVPVIDLTTAPAVPTTKAPDNPAIVKPIPVSPKESPRIVSSPRAHSTGSLPPTLKKQSSLRLLTSSGIFSKLDTTPVEKVVIEIVSLLRDALPHFKQDWEGLPPASRDELGTKLSGLVQRAIPPPSEITTPHSSSEATAASSSGSADDDEDDEEAMLELQKIIKLKNTADWGMMSLSLKHKFSRKQGSFGDSDTVNAITIPEIPKKLKEMSACISEATVDLLDKVNGVLTSIQQKDAGIAEISQMTAQMKRKSIMPKDSWTYLGNAVEDMYSILKMTLGLTSKWRTSEEEKPKSLPRPPQSPDEERQRAQKGLVHRVLGQAITIAQSASKKGKHIDKIVTAFNTCPSSSASYMKLKLEESLDYKIYNESTGIRALAAQLMSAINALLDEQPSDATNFSNVLQIEAAGRSLVLTVGRLLDSLETLKYITEASVEAAAGDKQAVVTSTLLEDDEKDAHIWDDEGEVIITDTGAFKAGTLNAIVRRLTSDTNYDTKFLSTFIATYQSFTTPGKLLEKLLERYDAKGRVEDKRVMPIQLRVCVVLKYWIANQCADFDKSLISALKSFLTNQLPKDSHVELSKQLANLLITNLEELSVKKKGHTVNPFSSLQVQERHSPAALFSALNESEIARQLTLIEFDLFQQIKPSELFNQSWNKPKLHHRAPHILNMISRANHLSFWVASLLLWNPTLKDRVAVLTKLIKIAQHLRELNNFNTLMGVVAGINMSAISRLKQTFGELDKGAKQILDNLQVLLNPSSSFKNYRSELHNAHPPCLPYLGTYLTDLTFMEDGNQDTLKSKTGKQPLINFAKRELVYNVLRELQLYQQSAYKFPVVEPIHTFLTALPFGDDKDLYELSLLREPREPSRN